MHVCFVKQTENKVVVGPVEYDRNGRVRGYDSVIVDTSRVYHGDGIGAANVSVPPEGGPLILTPHDPAGGRDNRVLVFVQLPPGSIVKVAEGADVMETQGRSDGSWDPTLVLLNEGSLELANGEELRAEDGTLRLITKEELAEEEFERLKRDAYPL